MAERGAVTRALLMMACDGGDDALAEGICAAFVDGVDVDGGALSLMTAGGARETLWTTDRVAELIEDLQFTLDEGACVEASVTGSPVLVPDLREDCEMGRWPLFAAALAEQCDIRALFALPLHWGTVNLGVLDLYRATPGGLTDAQGRDALTAADAAALMILGLRTDPGDGHCGWLDHALTHRAEVHQATGMVLAQLGISATDALARMRAHAFARQRLLIDVARDVVERRLNFAEDVG